MSSRIETNERFLKPHENLLAGDPKAWVETELASSNGRSDKQLNLLVVEDDPDDIFLIREALTAGGFTGKVMTAIDGQEALEYITGAGPFQDRNFFPVPELILLDLNLPKRNGFEVLQFLRKHRLLKRVPVIVLTTSATQSDIDAAYDLGANGYLQKPGNFHAFIDSLKRLQTMWNSDFKKPRLN
jgi:CheY-like chemotaxis protein